MLLPGAAKPLPSAEICRLIHGDSVWLEALPAVRHYAYPIHPSGSFLESRTLAASLYLLAVRFFSREYASAFTLAEACVSDEPLSPEEAQLWALLDHVAQDDHPDAIAVQLKLSLVTLGSERVMSCPWSVSSRMEAYVLKVNFVSAACRLSREVRSQSGRL